MIYECRPIPGYEGLYEIDTEGSVFCLNYKKKNNRVMMKCGIDQEGYKIITLTLNRKPKMHEVHRLVMRTFVGERPEGMEVRHLNGDRSDARLENLVYGTRTQNNIDSLYHLTHPHQKLRPDQIMGIFNDPRSTVEIAKEYGVSSAQVSNIKSGKQWWHITGKVYQKREFKLSEQDVVNIYFDTRNNKDIAQEYGVSEFTIYNIKHHVNRKQITERFRTDHAQSA